MFNKTLSILLFLLPAGHVDSQSSEGPAVIISLKAVAGMQYDIVRFAVRPGANVKVILTNGDEMEHNLVFTKPGSRQEIVDAALKLGQAGPKKNYIPESSNLLWFIPVLKPGQTDSITFSAPRKTGVYPYVCTFPGHGFVMYGAMHVTNGVMPQITADLDVPPGRRNEDAGEAAHRSREKPAGHPYEPVPPYLYRVLLPDAGPAAIAVSLPNKLSYCWDAGACRLRYAWMGEFLDLTDYWTIKGELYGKILGVIFYRDKTEYPLRVGKPDKIPSLDFKGYRLIHGYPEFHYAIDGLDVFELIHSKADGSGLIRTIRIPGANQPVWFFFDPEDGVKFDFSTGALEKGRLRLPAIEARSFSITMTKAGGSGL